MAWRFLHVHCIRRGRLGAGAGRSGETALQRPLTAFVKTRRQPDFADDT